MPWKKLLTHVISSIDVELHEAHFAPLFTALDFSFGEIPAGDRVNEGESIEKQQILGGLHHHYFRSSA